MAGLRIPGVGSGLDTDAIVSQLMALEKKPVELLQKKSDTLTTTASAWRDLNLRLLNLQNRVADLRSATLWDARAATVGDSAIATATATSAAAMGTHTLTTAVAQSTVWLSRTNFVDPDVGVGTAGTLVINSAGANNGKTINVAATDSLRDIAAKINNDPTLGLRAEFVQVGFNFRLQVSSQNGATNDFTLSDQTGTVAQDLQILGTGPNAGAKLQTASDYKVTIDGTTTTSATNVFANVLPGVTVTVLKGSSTSTALTVGRDDTKLVKAVKDFVDQYNSTVDFMASQTSYDTKNKKPGTLSGQSLVASIDSTLDRKATTPVIGLPATYQLLSQVGISTPKFSKGETLSRKLTFDENKFKAALAVDPAAVKNLFIGNGGGIKGVAVRTEEWLTDFTRKDGLVLGQADAADKGKKAIQAQIDNWNTVILPAKEQRLKNQYSALDRAMTLLHNQGTWLDQQLASMSGSNKK